MKIFNWMNKKFASKDERSLKKGEFIAKETDRKPLIENLGVVDVKDVDWRANLLTIGTLGFDHFQKFIPDNEEYFDDPFGDELNEEDFENNDDDDDDEYPDEELFEKNNNEVQATNLNSPVITTLQSFLVKDDGINKTIDGNNLQPPKRNEKIVDCGFKKGDEKDLNDGKKKKVTLAELFSAETIEDMKGHNNEKDAEKNVTSKCDSGHSKAKLSSAKKLIPGVARVDARLAHKLNRMVTRMLKKKIHPDPASQGKHQKDKQNKSTTIFGHQLSVKHSINETVSLLRTTDVEI